MASVPLEPQPKPELDNQLAVIRTTITSITITDKITYTSMLAAKTAAQNYIKAVGHELDPGIQKAKELLDHLKQQKAKFVDPAEEIIETAKVELKKYITEEERKAAEEQARINEAAERDRALKAEAERIEAEKVATAKRQDAVAEIRGKLQRKEITKREAEKLLRMAGANEEADKAAAAAQAEEKKAAPAPKVDVKADLPKMAGTRRSRSYKFMVIDAAKIPREWCKPDEVRIGEEVRRLKDDAASMKAIPGIKAWNEPSI